MKHFLFLAVYLLFISSCLQIKSESKNITISKVQYKDQLEGFWLGQCIANWTGLITEMDKIGNVGEIKTGDFYTRDNWGAPDEPNIWSDSISDISPVIDFVLRDTSEIWGADDDTDIEYMYQHLLFENRTSFLTPEQIRDGWLKHIKAEEENYLWVSNQKAFDLMHEGKVPPNTSQPYYNEHYEMIDAQLTTEIFGLFAPGRPDIALRMAHLPIRTTARENAAWISEFYVIMYSLASSVDPAHSIKEQVFSLAEKARGHLPKDSYSAKMYDYVKSKYDSGISWEAARDSIYQRYQVDQKDGYDITSKGMYCNGCFAAGINFAASLVSLFYGEGDFKETLKIGVLCGWDSDNPTATWGGLLGFMMGRNEIEDLFGHKLSSGFNIHRTRQNFPDDGLDDFEHMGEVGLEVTERVILEEMEGKVDHLSSIWAIPMIEQKN